MTISLSKLFKYISLIVCFLLEVQGFSQPFKSDINTVKEYKAISSKPITNKYGNTIAVKVVLDLDDDELYFINARQYNFHNRFCRDILAYNYDLTVFNDRNYTQHNKRQFLLGNINYIESSDLFFLELSPIDLMNTKQILKLYKAIQKHSFLNQKFTFLVNTSRLTKLKKELENQFPIVTPSEIYKDLIFQPISQYKGEGHLRFVKNIETEKESLNPKDIIVIDKVPLILPDVAGIIVSEFQTPLSHLTILGRNRKIPIAAIKKAFTDSLLLSLKDKPIRFSVTSQKYYIKEIVTLNQKSKKKKSIKLLYNLKADSIIDIEHINKKSYKIVGNKAANFGVLHKLALKNDFKVPEQAFTIPFYFYHQHSINSKTENLVRELILNKHVYKKTGILEKKLLEIQNQIKNHPIDSKLINQVENKIKRQSEYKRFRFRSSTNAEDAKGFSGAGLYKSKTGILDHSTKTIEKAIKKVWASLWSIEAFSERERFNMNHLDVYMGILIHRSFPNEAVNGVVVTKNLYRKKGYGFVVNAQLGNDNVVKPKQGVVNDQFICYPSKTEFIYSNTIDIISTSNLNQNRLVMTEKEIIHLANMLEIIKKKVYSKSSTTKSYLNYGLDLEFKLDGKNRDLYIKQMRVYND